MLEGHCVYINLNSTPSVIDSTLITSYVTRQNFHFLPPHLLTSRPCLLSAASSTTTIKKYYAQQVAHTRPTFYQSRYRQFLSPFARQAPRWCRRTSTPLLFRVVLLLQRIQVLNNEEQSPLAPCPLRSPQIPGHIPLRPSRSPQRHRRHFSPFGSPHSDKISRQIHYPHQRRRHCLPSLHLRILPHPRPRRRTAPPREHCHWQSIRVARSHGRNHAQCADLPGR